MTTFARLLLVAGMFTLSSGFSVGQPPTKKDEPKKDQTAEKAAVEAKEKKTAIDKEAWALHAPAANPKKDNGYCWQIDRLKETVDSRTRFNDFFKSELRGEMERSEKGSGKNVDLELTRREKVAKEKYDTDLYGLFKIVVKYKESREALFLNTEEIVELLKSGNLSSTEKSRLRSGKTPKGLDLPKAVPIGDDK